MKRKTAMVCVISSLLVLGFAFDAFSQITQVGPTNPTNGFPSFYGAPLTPGGPVRRLALCLTDLVCEFDAVIDGNAFSQTIGFGGGAFYWGATADIGQTASLEMGVRAGFRGGTPTPNGIRTISNFIRIDLRNVPDGTYRVTHPFGVEVVNTAAAGNADVILGVTGRNPGVALNGPVTHFLRGNPTPGFVGSFAELQRITGSPRGTNFFRVRGLQGQDIGGPGAGNVITTNLFRIQGRFAP